MKKKCLLLLIIPIVIVITVLAVFFINKDTNTHELFHVNDRYYNSNRIVEITKEDLIKKENNKESFLLFIYQPMCFASDKFNIILYDFVKKYDLSFLKIQFSEIEETELETCIKYYPSISIYKDGKVVAYLDANEDEDTKYYKSVNDFKSWLEQFIYIKKEV